MTKEQLEWLMKVVNFCPVQDTADVRHKATWLNALADRIEQADRIEKAAKAEAEQSAKPISDDADEALA